MHTQDTIVMKKFDINLLLVLELSATLIPTAKAQQLSLDNAIRIAQENSYDAQVAQFSYLASYWTWRSFKAELKPAVNLYGSLAGFDHSLVSTRNYEDGRINYVDNNSMDNYLTLSIDQQIAATGGTISLRSYLYRLDQFTYNETTWETQPLRISYTQPLKAYNSLKWQKKTAPLEYQIAQKTYLANMQSIAINVTTLFFSVLEAQSNLKQSQAKLTDRDSLLVSAQRRLSLGTITKADVLQLELSAINARVSVNSNLLNLNDRLYKFFAYLRVSDYEGVELIPPSFVPDVLLSADEVLETAIRNSAHSLEQKNNILAAEMALAKAKSNQGLQMTLNSKVGLTKTAHTFSSAYSNLQDNEVIGLSFSLPIFDWGVSRGKVKMAQAKLEMVRTQQEQAHLDYIQDLRKKVMQFNMQPTQCRDALRAQEIAEERYDITRRRFETGAISVTDLNTAQQELESAKAQYINQLETFWSDYYALQKATLHDWISNVDLQAPTDSPEM